jgi:hypothetical protein
MWTKNICSLIDFATNIGVIKQHSVKDFKFKQKVSLL